MLLDGSVREPALALVDQTNGLQKDVSVDGKAASADLVHGVLRGVVVAVVWAIVEVNDVDGRDSPFDEREMIVFDGLVGLKEVPFVASFSRGLTNEVYEPACGVCLTLNVEILITNHVCEHKGLDLAQCTVASPLGGEVPAAVGGVGSGPVLEGFFTVEEDEPDGVAIKLFAADLVSNGHQQAGGCGSVVGSYEVDVAQRVVGFVVGSEDNDAVLLAGKANDEIMKRDRANGRVGGEGVFFELILFEVAADEGFGFDVSGASGPAGADGRERFGVVVCFGAVEASLCERRLEKESQHGKAEDGCYPAVYKADHCVSASLARLRSG